MTITEFAILVFKSPPNFLDPTLQSLFRQLSAWQSECSGFPLLFFTNRNDSLEVHLVTGWASVAAHEAWIRGERNQELLRMFAPHVDMQKIRMVHLSVNFEAIPSDADAVVERYDAQLGEKSTPFEWERSDRSRWSLTGGDLARDGRGDASVFRFVGVAGGGEVEVSGGVVPVERWVLKRVDVER
jgi:hypothetical protein